MAKLKIAHYPEEEKLLRERCKPILKITDKTRQLIDDMIETMHEAAGVGLAAPQVFQTLRLFVYDLGDGSGSHAIINPEIISAEGEEAGEEGCLSIPRLRGDVPRATRITVTGLDRSGKRLRIDAQDFLARVFQHEIDHLNGVLFTDRVVDKKSLHWITEEDESERQVSARRRRVRIATNRE